MDPHITAPLKGLFAGVTGTVVMTMALRRLFPRVLPARARRGFLPELVVSGLERAATGRERLRPSVRRRVTMPAHYGYGAAAGVGYGLLRAALPGSPAAPLGAAWGLAVWAASYQGWLPAAGIAPATTSRPPGRRVVPVGAHVVFGIATAYAFEALSADPEGDAT